MEQEEEYKQLRIKLREAHQHLRNLNNLALIKAHKEAKKSVQDHFDKLAAALITRRDQLLEIVDNVFKQKEHIEGGTISINQDEPILAKLQQDSFTLNVTSNAYQVRSEQQGPKPKQIQFLFSEELIKHIHDHGQVLVDDKPSTLCNLRPESVITLAGSNKGSSDGVASKAQFNSPQGIAFNPLDDCLYVCDYKNNVIRKVTQLGEVTKFVTLNCPIGICHYQKENCFFVSEYDMQLVKRVLITGETQAFAGTGKRGNIDGPSGSSQFNYPRGITVDQQTGDVYVAEYYYTIRKISQGQVSTVAGNPSKSGHANGDNQSALFGHLHELCFSQYHQALFVCDFFYNKVRKVSLKNANTITICEVKTPAGIAVHSNGSILISSADEHKLYSLSGTETLKTFAGTGTEGSEDGEPLQCSFNYPYAISVDEKTNTYFISDPSNHRIRAIKCA